MTPSITERVTNPTFPEDTDEGLATMAVVPISESDEVVDLQPNQNLASDSGSGDDSDGPDESTLPRRTRPKTHGKARAKKERKSQIQAQSAAQPGHQSLRPAKDILSRIRHDPSLDQEDFIVGYSDRHADTQELPVTLWKGDVTDDEFIPQHRILYFRRVGDGVKVWDRAERLDLLFGSGKRPSSVANDGDNEGKNSVTKDKKTA